MLGLIELIVIQIGLNLLARELEPKRKRPKPAPFEAPTASSGTPMARGMGVYECQPTVTLVDDIIVDPDEQDDQPITRYYAKLQLVFGWEAHVLYDIVADERSIRTQIPGKLQSIDGDDPNIIYPLLPRDFRNFGLNRTLFSINARHMFGGGTDGGGLQGMMAFYPGRFTPELDELIEEKYGDRASRYPWHCHAVLGRESGHDDGLSVDGLNQQGEKFYVSANRSAPPPISAVLGYYPNALLGGNGQIGIAGNWVEMLYEILINKRWGGRIPTSRFDIAQWQDQAQREKDLGIGMAIPQDSPKTVADVVEDIFSHAEAGIVEDPETGLLQIKTARADYDIDDLLVINKSNSENFKRGKPIPAKTLNDLQVRYRRFFGGVSGSVVEEIVTSNFHVNTGFGSHRAYGYKTAGENIDLASVHVYSNGVELTIDVDFSFNPLTGALFVYEDSALVDLGDEITISYVSNPGFVAFIDDVATSQNIANNLSTGRQQPESFDYTYFIDPFTAQWKVDRLRATLSRSLDRFSWVAKRDQSHLTPWDVVLINEPAYGVVNMPARITRISGGTRTNPQITIEAIKDVWGEEILFKAPDFSIGRPNYKPPAPLIPIGCGVGGVDVARINLFPTSAIFTVELYEATDDTGTGSTLVQTFTAGTDPMFYDGDPTKWYAARQLHASYAAGPLTAWIQCADVDGPPVDPECILPVVGFTYDPYTYTVVLTITNNDQGRVTKIEFNIRDASGTWSGWEAVPADAPTIATGVAGGRIEWRVSYVDCDGNDALATGGVDLTPPEVPPVEDTPVTYLPVVLLAPGAAGLVKYGIGSDRVAIMEGRSTEDFPPLNGATAVYLAARIRASNVNVGCYLSADIENLDALDDWHPIQDDSVDATLTGPTIAVDPDSLELLDANPNQGPYNVKSAEVPVRLEANSIIRVRGVIGGGDTTGGIIISSATLWFRFGPATPETLPPIEEPPPENPGSCDVPSMLDNFNSYANLAALDAAWPDVVGD